MGKSTGTAAGSLFGLMRWPVARKVGRAPSRAPTGRSGCLQGGHEGEDSMTVNIDDLLSRAAAELCRFLGKRLPTLGDENWWIKRVVDRLSFQQQRYVEQRGISELGGLDLAALIRILDQNWYDLNWKESFPPDARHFVKEMQTVRNRWAHASVQEYPQDDVYRDLDTLQRFLAVIGSSEELQNKVRSERKKLVNPEQAAVERAPDTKTASAQSQNKELAFQITQIVQLRSDSSKRSMRTTI